MANDLTIQDVMKRFYPAYTDVYAPSGQQRKVAQHIMNCKTGAYGFNISICDSCGMIQYHNNSCRDRACPMCQALNNEMWVDAQRESVLDVDYYHLVFTCPDDLNPLIYSNQRELYTLFFHASAETVRELCEDPAHIGAVPGFITILHTWGSNLSFHPHVHVLSTCGGLNAERQWKHSKKGYFLPGKALAELFKGKFLSGMKELHDKGKLVYEGEAEKYRNHYEYQALLNQCYNKEWVTDIRESFAGAETVMHYLGRYTHRIAISNSRILRMDGDTVTIKVKDYKDGGKWKEQTLRGVEFIRRFLMHVLPKRFMRIRHYGLISNHNK